MRLVLSALFLIGLCAGSAAGEDNEGGAFGQLQDATSGTQTLGQTYGDSTHGPGCPDECPTGDADVPDASPPAPADDSGDSDS